MSKRFRSHPVSPTMGCSWRKIAAWGAQQGPEWLVKHSPAFFGLASGRLGAECAPQGRRESPAHSWRSIAASRGGRDAGKTFTTYAGCLAEVLSNGSKNARVPEAELIGRERVLEAAALKKGIVVVTIHTGDGKPSPVLLVHRTQSDDGHGTRARSTRTESCKTKRVARRGLVVATSVVRPLDSLPLAASSPAPEALWHCKSTGCHPEFEPSLCAFSVHLARFRLGPLRLAQLSGAPLVPIFCSRVWLPKLSTRSVAPDFPNEASLTRRDQRGGAKGGGRGDGISPRPPDAVVSLRRLLSRQAGL